MTQVDFLAEVSTVRSHVRAISSKDWDVWRTTVTPTVSYDEPATLRRLGGVEAVIEALRIWTTAFPDVQGRITNAGSSGSQVFAEITWEGTQTGPLVAPQGTIPASGRRGSIRAVEVFAFEGDRIAQIRHYFDLLSLLRQVGALPRV